MLPLLICCPNVLAQGNKRSAPVEMNISGQRQIDKFLAHEKNFNKNEYGAKQTNIGHERERILSGMKAGHGWQNRFSHSDTGRLQHQGKESGGPTPLQDFQSKQVMVGAELVSL